MPSARLGVEPEGPPARANRVRYETRIVRVFRWSRAVSRKTGFHFFAAQSQARTDCSARPDRCAKACYGSEIKSAFTGALGQSLHAAVVEIRAAVEHDLGDAGLPGALGDKLADGLRGFDVRAGLQRPA